MMIVISLAIVTRFPLSTHTDETPSVSTFVELHLMYDDYVVFCRESGHIVVDRSTFRSAMRCAKMPGY